jgi:DNA-binding response OmpR family regulator
MNLSVLVVENDDSFRASLVQVLRRQGYQTLEAPSGVAARALLENEPVDVMILDLRLPLLTGEELLKELTNPPPVIVLSGFAYFDQDEVCRRLAGKVKAFIRKPSPPHVVLSAVEDAVRS